ncbi:AsmA family protein [Natronospira sp. AB-CW4]|uniref:AsmA family protein n=1 Tax=Natronospira bacteriovora TaxID=3069753 RepID=A0ABU0W7V7_9GAMM|nr:AsmA family protein [Natronospira sp. AB-CW4]MDQ2070122.1 AsmA family protein [Natronospira sp. AB-CW4]
MRKLAIVLGILLAALLALLAIAVVAVSLLFDPNDYREDIEQAVRDATGRELRIEEDLSLSVFPWLGVETGRVVLGNAEGFEGDFFRLDAADVRLRLIPLIRGRLEVAEIRVDGLQLHLAVNADGVGNWEDLIVEVDEPAEAPPVEEGELDLAALEAITVGGLRLSNAALSWRDETTGLQAEASNWALRLGEIRWGDPLNFDTGLDFRLNEPAMSGRFEGEGLLLAVLNDENRIYLNDMAFRLDLEGEDLPDSPLAMRLGWDSLVMDMDADGLALEGLVGRLGDMPFGGEVVVARLSEAPAVDFRLASGEFPATALAPFLDDAAPEGLRLQGLGELSWRLAGQLDLGSEELVLGDGWLNFGHGRVEFPTRITALGSEEQRIQSTLRLSEFSPRALLEAIGLADEFLPETRDPDVLTRFSLTAAFGMQGESLSLEDMDIVLDDSRITGQLRLPSLEPLALRFDLGLDAIDLDRYTAPDEDAPVVEGEPLDLDAIEIPVDAIRGQDVDGRLRIDRLQLAGMNLESVEAGVRIADDRLRLAPIDARLYGGRQSGELLVDASGDEPVIRFTERLSDVRIAGLLGDLFNIEQLSGLANVHMELSGRGRTVGELRPTLNGNMRLAFDEGAVEGTDLAHEFSRATRSLREDRSVREDRGRTPFSALGLSGTVEEGRLVSEDFALITEGLMLSGGGWLSLVDLSMDYRLGARLRGEAGAGMGADDGQLQGRELALRMTGTPLAPRFSFDTDRLLRQLAEERTRDTRERAREEARETEEELRQRLRDMRRR